MIQPLTQKVGTLGNDFIVTLNTPISVPKNAVYCTLEVVSASIWNTSPNISAEIGNNMFYVTINGNALEITIPDGLYGVGELESFLQQSIVNEDLAEDDISLSENGSTQQVVIIFGKAGTSIDFTKPNSCREILGFDDKVVNSTGAGSNVFGDKEAEFNRVVHYFIKSNVLRSGIPQNSTASGIISSIPITSKVGSLINYTPTNPLRCNADELIGNSKQTIQFTLLDQLERQVSTGGEEWSLAIVIRYYTHESPQKISHAGLGAHGNMSQSY